MAKEGIGLTATRHKPAKRTKSQRTKPNRPRDKKYRGQGKP